MNRSNKPLRKEEVWLNYEADGSKVQEHKHLITERYVGLMGGTEEAERKIRRHKHFAVTQITKRRFHYEHR